MFCSTTMHRETEEVATEAAPAQADFASFDDSGLAGSAAGTVAD